VSEIVYVNDEVPIFEKNLCLVSPIICILIIIKLVNMHAVLDVDLFNHLW